MKKRIAVLVSGGGTNLQALLEAEEAGLMPHGEIALVISNNPDAYALQRARAFGVPAGVITRAECGSKEAFEETLQAVLERNGTDLIILAGFMAILSENFTSKWPKRIINVHPSLIPSFCGEGFYGLKVHEAALNYGVKVTGATVHFVNEIPDGLCANIDKSAVRILPIFDLIAKTGNIPERDMFNTYNMGVGMSVVVPAEQVDTALEILRSHGEDAYVIGTIIENEEKVILE